MSYSKYLKTTSALLGASLLYALPSLATAQEEDILVIEEVVVTGSYIKRKSQEDSPSPLNILGRSDISAQGLNTVGDIARNFTFASGSEINTDAFTQNFSTGTANVNLRGLGLSSTLVLLNGRRQTLSAAYADDGSTFVDTNSLVPMIMVERVETLKDGGSATYGTDAVAGVVNYITRKDFVGFEIEGRFQTTTEDSQRDYDLGAIWGTEVGEGGNFVIAAAYKKRDPLRASDRPELTDGTGISGSGQPGTIFIPGVTNPATGDTLPLIDPACEGSTLSIPDVIAPGAALGLPLDVGLCRFQFDPFYDLVAEEENFQAFASFTQDFADDMNFYMEVGYANNKANRSNAPAFPIAETVIVPSTHPGTPLEIQGIRAALGINPAVPNVFLGRLLGGDADPLITDHDNETFRIAAELSGSMGSSWSWNLAGTYSENEFFLTVEDVLRDAYFNALATGTYNPYGTNQTTLPNSPEVIDSLIAELSVVGNTSLFTFDAVVTGELFELGDNMVSAAFGAQYRNSDMDYDWSDDYNGPNGDGTNGGNLITGPGTGGNLMFLFGGGDFGADQDVYALFGEFLVPLGDTLEVTLAARYEDYGDGLNSFDPKISALWRPMDNLSLRGSFSTAFRAPSLFNTVAQQTSLVEIDLAGTSTFRPVTSFGSADLQPEEADIYNVGFTWEIVENLSFSTDYWRYEFTNLITQENAQSIVNRALAGDMAALAKLDFGTPGDFSTLFRIRTDIINAPTVTTDGLDLSLNYTHDMGTSGTLNFGAEATYVFQYSAVDQAGMEFDGAGSRNFNNFARSIPEWRANAHVSWYKDNHAVAFFARYIDSYLDDQNNVTVPSYTTFDAQYSYLLGDADENTGTRLTVGVINIFDKDIPRLDTNAGFDVKVHDPRQRMVYVSVKQNF
ncbi:TonB-dependent receptor plug domain-containing protein [Luteithermobacter gelatinilyticus]|uniref:TonB-dependent receptor plug domain-containing protein n=1 Tax=Luteithermobacter gelatinilyticus TaxID=2582913 RepID=UPI00143DFD37|nr:TonB-dependent receptor [Luteithermobacter gelatinilyticus]